MVLTANRGSMPGANAGRETADAANRVSFQAMGTQCEIQYIAPDRSTGDAFARDAVAWTQGFEAKYSRFLPDSLIGRINAAAGYDWVPIDADAEHMFALADQVYALSRGIIDPSALPFLRLWNYKAAKPRIPTPEEISLAASRVGWKQVRREPGRIYLPNAGMGLDLGGFGKEYAVDTVVLLAEAYGVRNVLVDFGRDIRVAGTSPNAPCWLVGVEEPRSGGNFARLAVTNQGIASSGHHRRYFEIDGRRYGHIVDPRTGYPVQSDCLAVTIVANSCLEAGLLSTTAFALGPEAGLQLIEEFFGAEGCIQCEDRDLQTQGFCRYVL